MRHQAERRALREDDGRRHGDHRPGGQASWKARCAPSSDLATHVALYRAFPDIGGVVHTHSRHATAWAQANREIPCFGTTHADYFHGAIPVTAQLSREEIETDYEANTGVAIIARMKGLDPLGCPACLVAGHAPFCWGKTVTDAAHMAVIVEEIAAMAWQTVTINPQPGRSPRRCATSTTSASTAPPPTTARSRVRSHLRQQPLLTVRLYDVYDSTAAAIWDIMLRAYSAASQKACCMCSAAGASPGVESPDS